jgi:hypothetical protein
MFTVGSATLPEYGMGRIGDTLAAKIPAEQIMLNTRSAKWYCAAESIYLAIVVITFVFVGCLNVYLRYYSSAFISILNIRSNDFRPHNGNTQLSPNYNAAE